MTSPLDALSSITMARITQAAALAAFTGCGRGNEQMVDTAAVSAMHRELSKLPFQFLVAVGDEDLDLYTGQTFGSRKAPRVDIAADPLECHTACAKHMPGAMSCLAFAEDGALLHAPDVYMEKMAVGPGYSKDIIDLDSPSETIQRVAAEKGVAPAQLSVVMLERPRNSDLIAKVRASGVDVQLILDGDIAGVVQTAHPDTTGIDIYMGIGGAPEAVLAACALRCIGGQMHTRFSCKREDERRALQSVGITDLRRTYRLEDMVNGHCIFAATGVTDSPMLRGIRVDRAALISKSVVMVSSTREVHWITTEHPVK